MAHDSRCPVCGRQWTSRCKCPRSDMQCSLGHKWHTCVIHQTIVMGYSDHSIPIERCTCRIGDTESGNTIVKLPPLETTNGMSPVEKVSNDLGAGI